MPAIVGKSSTVVQTPDLKIDELAGNVATSDDTISIAYVSISEPTAEPWLTLDYDEWLCVLKGKMVLHYFEAADSENTEEKTMEVNAGETAFIAKGERFKPVFPVAPTEYVPVCLPAFRPDRCHREEEEEDVLQGGSDVTKKLLELHNMETETAKEGSDENQNQNDNENVVDDDVLYHMCQKTLWDDAMKSQKAYYPPTFVQDGNFTHATAVPQRLVDTANHFYTESEGDWICIQLSRSALTDLGIVTRDESGMPVGDTAVDEKVIQSEWKCPHVYGGIPTRDGLGVFVQSFPMVRNEAGDFLKITGLTN